MVKVIANRNDVTPERKLTKFPQFLLPRVETCRYCHSTITILKDFLIENNKKKERIKKITIKKNKTSRK